MKIKITIPDPIKKIFQILDAAEGKPRLVGGSVRDAILNIPTSDLDIVTTLLPQKVIDLLTHQGIVVKETGIKFGTVTAFIQNQHAQITTLRLDKDCDGRRVNAEFIDDFESDAKRRDFTINAMSYCPFKEELYDYLGGYADLLARRVVFIGDPAKRIEEDYLRILRFFRFTDKFADVIDDFSLQSCIKLKKGLMQLSKERILMEMTKIIDSPTGHKTLQIMIENEILKDVIPLKLDTKLLTALNEDASNILRADISVKCAALMIYNEPQTLKKILFELKFSNKLVENISVLVVFKNKYFNLDDITENDIKNIFLHLWVRGKDIASYMLITEFWKNKYFENLYYLIQGIPPTFPIKGGDLINIGLAGRDIKEMIEKLKDKWIESEFMLSKEELLKVL